MRCVSPEDFETTEELLSFPKVLSIIAEKISPHSLYSYSQILEMNIARISSFKMIYDIVTNFPLYFLVWRQVN